MAIELDRDSGIPVYPTGPCMTCRHFRLGAAGRTCDAFEEAIPLPIWTGEHDHRTPYAGDGGIRYERGAAHAR